MNRHALAPDEARCVIAVDGHPREVNAGTTLADLVAELGHLPHEVATAVDGEFVARTARTVRTLRANESVTLFQPIVGG